MSIPAKTRVIKLAEEPGKEQLQNKHFKIEEEELKQPGDGQALIKLLEFGPDPYQRHFIDETGEGGFAKIGVQYKVGKTIFGYAVAKILKLGGGDSIGFKEGDLITGALIPWGEYAVIDLNETRGYGSFRIRKLIEGEDQTLALGVAGLVGLTAYFGLVDLPVPTGEKKTIVISAAAGGVGLMVYWISKIQSKPYRVVGIAGSQEKLEYLKQIGFSEAVSYKSKTFEEDLKKACPDGVDYYWDNVGGSTAATVLKLLKYEAAVLCCGAISGYNTDVYDNPLHNWFDIVLKALTIKGTIVTRHLPEYPKAIQELVGWANEGKLKLRTTRDKGLDKAIESLIGLFKGDNIGKALVHIADP